MKWLNFFDSIYLINLDKRTDRLLDFAEQAEKYSIPFQRIPAILNINGAEGLRDTMLQIFNECIEKNIQNVLIFEDDCDFISGVDLFHDIMNKVVEQVPPTYHMVFLGCQLSVPPASFHSPNLMQVIRAFSTHAVFYSLQGMKEIITRGFDFPIDNYYVSDIEPMGHTYATYPILCSQRDGVSDIGGRFISWKAFIEQRFEQQVNLMSRR